MKSSNKEQELLALCAKEKLNSDDYKAIRQLIDSGVDINCVDSQNNPPIYYALANQENGDYQLLRLLLGNNRISSIQFKIWGMKESRPFTQLLLQNILDDSELCEELIDFFINSTYPEKQRELAFIEANEGALNKDIVAKFKAALNNVIEKPAADSLVKAVANNKDKEELQSIITRSMQAGNITEILTTQLNGNDGNAHTWAVRNEKPELAQAILELAKTYGCLDKVVTTQTKNANKSLQNIHTAEVFKKPSPRTLFMHVQLGKLDEVRNVISQAEKAGNIEELLTARSDDNIIVKSDFGKTAVMIAAEKTPQILEELLNAASSAGILEKVLKAKHNNHTPLLYAELNGLVNTQEKRIKIVKTAKEAISTAAYLFKSTISKNFPETLKNAKNKGQLSYVLNARDESGYTLFGKAIRQSNTQKIDYLIDVMKDTNLSKDQLIKNIFTVENAKVFEKLLIAAKDAKVLKEVLFAVDANGNSLLEICVMKNYLEHAKAILKMAKESNIIPDVLRAETKYGTILTASLKNKWKGGWLNISPLLFAAAKEAEIIPELVTKVGIDGDSALITAAKSGAFNCMAPLIENTPDHILKNQLVMTDKEGKNVLMHLLENTEYIENKLLSIVLKKAKQLGILEQLLVAQDKKGETLLIKAAKKRLGDVSVIVDAAKDAKIIEKVVHIKDHKGKKALNYAKNKHSVKRHSDTNDYNSLYKLSNINKLEDIAVKLVKADDKQATSLQEIIKKYHNKSILGQFFYELFGSYGLKGDIRIVIPEEIIIKYTEYKNTSRKTLNDLKTLTHTDLETKIKSVVEDITIDTNIHEQAVEIREFLIDIVVTRYNDNKEKGDQITKDQLDENALIKIDIELEKIIGNKQRALIFEDKKGADFSKVDPKIVEKIVKIALKEVRSLDKKHFAEKLLKSDNTTFFSK